MENITLKDVSIGKIEVSMASMNKSIDEIKAELKEQRLLYATKVELQEVKDQQVQFVRKDDLKPLWGVTTLIGATVILAIANAFLKLINL